MEKLIKKQLQDRRLKKREVLINSWVRHITLGCLPVLLQVPIMITVYQSILYSIKKLLSMVTQVICLTTLRIIRNYDEGKITK